MKTIAFFNNKGGVGKTSLVYHLAWMFREMDHRVLAVDLDPQSNLSSAFLDDDELEALWPEGDHPRTILGAVKPLMDHEGDIAPPEATRIKDGLWLIPGDLGLSAFEDNLSEAWGKLSAPGSAEANYAFRVTTAFDRTISRVGHTHDATLAMIDVGPSVGALNRSAMIAADAIVIPLGADLFSLQGLRNLGPTLERWRTEWRSYAREDFRQATRDAVVPQGKMMPLGYVLVNPSVRENRPVKAYRKWADRIPEVYATQMLREPERGGGEDTHQLAMLKHFKSLMPMAQDARKPMFKLTAADGAIGGHAQAVRDAEGQFRLLAERILDRLGGAAD